MELNYRDLLLLALPGIISAINRPYWSGPVKFLVAVGICFLASLVELLLTGGGSLSDLPGAFGKAFALCMMSYATIWKAWRIADKVEEKINPGNNVPQ